MLRFVLTEKFVIGSFVFLLFFCVGCVIWYHYNTGTYRQESTESVELQDQTENTTQQTSDVSVEGNTPTSEESESVNTDDLSHSDETLQEEVESDETITVGGRVIRLSDIPDIPEVSPHGFGPFPDVPEDYPLGAVWRKIDYYDISPSDQRNSELFDRVLIKLWSEGNKNFTGAIRDGKTGKVYPNFPDTVYITVKDLEYPDGTVVPMITRQLGSAPGVDLFNPPPHIKVFDYESSGIDPFEYLDLP